MGMPPTEPPSPATPACGRPSRPAAGHAVAASRIAGAAVPQDCGTDNPPTAAARPSPADTPAPPSPDPYEPARVPSAPPGTPDTADTAATGASPTSDNSGLKRPKTEPPTIIGPNKKTASPPNAPTRGSMNWFAGVLNKVDIAAAPLNDPPEASDCSVLGTCESMFWVAPAGVAAAWVTAAAWVLVPAGLVVGGGGLNGVTVAAAAEAPAYPYIAAASWAHISAYCASVAAIAGVFCPTMLVATNAANNDRLTAMIGGGTVALNAAS